MGAVKVHKSPAPDVISDRTWSEVCEQFRRGHASAEAAKGKDDRQDTMKRWTAGYTSGQRDGFLQCIAAIYGNSFALAVCEAVGIDDPVGFW